MHLKHALTPLVVGAIAAPIAIASASPAVHQAARTTVKTHSSSHGTILETGSGMPLYLYSTDRNRRSTCLDGCAATWPPLIKHGRLHAGGSAKRSKLGTILRGKKRQVTYAGHPLYTFVSDSPNMVTGEGDQVGAGKFYLVAPNGKAIKH